MVRHVLLYGAALAVLALLVEWLDWRHATRELSTSLYILAVALLFAALGIWLGNRLTPRPRAADFVRNERALADLGSASANAKCWNCSPLGTPTR